MILSPDSIFSRYRFTILLVAFVILVISIPIAGAVPHPMAAHAILTLTFLVFLVVGGISAGRSRVSRSLVVILSLISVALGFWARWSDSQLGEAGSYIAALAVLATVSVLTIRELLSGQSVTYDKLSASLCAYAMLVAFWAVGYSLLELLQPGAFQYLYEEHSSKGMHFGFGGSGQALYFSLVTITTLGYGDIVPLSDLARLMAALQAFTGQAYIAVLVARLVGLHIRASG